MTWIFDTEISQLKFLITEDGDSIITENDEFIVTEGEAYTNDSSTSLVSWGDLETTWEDAYISWNGGGAYSYDTESLTTYVNDTI